MIIMCIINKFIKLVQNFNVWEIIFFKFYIVVATLILSIWFPVLLTAELRVYITIFVLLLIINFIIMMNQQGNFYSTIFTKWFWVHIFEKMGAFDITIFKTTMFFSWLLLAKLFPVFLTVHIARYIFILWLFIWYYFYPIFHDDLWIKK